MPHAYHFPLLLGGWQLLVTFTPLRDSAELQQFALICGAVAILGVIGTLVFAILLEENGLYMAKLSCAFAAMLIASAYCVYRGGAMSDAQKQDACEGNLRKLYRAAEAYAKDNDGRYPGLKDAHGWKLLQDGGYLRRGEEFRCPYAPESDRRGITYRYFAGKDKDDPPATVIIEDGCMHPGESAPRRVRIDGSILQP